MEGMILNVVLHVLTGQAKGVDGSLALDPAVAEVHRYDGDELVVVRLRESRACPSPPARTCAPPRSSPGSRRGWRWRRLLDRRPAARASDRATRHRLPEAR